MLPKVAQIVATEALHKLVFYKTAQKVIILLGYFCKQIWYQELSKIAQSGHTGRAPILSLSENFTKVVGIFEGFWYIAKF